MIVKESGRGGTSVKTRVLLTASLALLAASVAAALAGPSDWQEDDRPVPERVLRPITDAPRMAPAERPVGKTVTAGMPAPAPDFRSPARPSQPEESEPVEYRLQPAGNAGKGVVLQGQASSFGMAGGQSQMAMNAPFNPGQLSAQTAQFMAAARTNVPVPPEKLRGWLDGTHPHFLSAHTNPNAVVDVKGQWDDSDKVLRGLGIPHRHVKARELATMNLDDTRVLIINCEGRVPKESLAPIRNFVIGGGYLISTDWTLHTLIERLFPDYIAWNGRKTPGSVVDAIVAAPDSDLVAGVNVGRATWKLDIESQMVRVLRPLSVQVLARSWQLANIDPNRTTTLDPRQWGILAVEFPYGRGRILHLVGHYDYNSPPTFRQNILPDPMPGADISLRQVLATNFIVRALQAR